MGPSKNKFMHRKLLNMIRPNIFTRIRYELNQKDWHVIIWCLVIVVTFNWLNFKTHFDRDSSVHPLLFAFDRPWRIFELAIKHYSRLHENKIEYNSATIFFLNCFNFSPLLTLILRSCKLISRKTEWKRNENSEACTCFCKNLASQWYSNFAFKSLKTLQAMYSSTLTKLGLHIQTLGEHTSITNFWKLFFVSNWFKIKLQVTIRCMITGKLFVDAWRVLPLE